MKNLVSGIAASFVTFTCIPCRRILPAESFSDATWHIPLVAWFYWGMLAGVWSWLPGPLDFKILQVMVLPVVIGRVMHEDGLADSADGLFGGHTPEKRLAIMKDPQVGSFGVVTMVLYFLAYYLALKNIPEMDLIRVLGIVLPLSRFAAPLLAIALPYVRADQSKAKAYLGTNRMLCLWSLLWTLPIGYFWTHNSIYGLVGSAFALIGCGLIFHKKLGGVTGDCLGATIKCIELAGLWSFAFAY
mgnify:CR=1 FL=1